MGAGQGDGLRYAASASGSRSPGCTGLDWTPGRMKLCRVKSLH